MTCRIIVPPGIGDFSWLWTKFSTTKDNYNIEYADTGPNRLEAYLKLLPSDKIHSISLNKNYTVQFYTNSLKMCINPSVTQLEKYNQFSENPDQLYYVEANTHVEHGLRIENWMPELKADFHYKINGTLENVQKDNIFIVHLSSFKMERIWKTYSIAQWLQLISMIQKKTGWRPVFIGAEYDDCAKACYAQYIEKHSATSLIGQTPELLGTLRVMQRARMFLGAVSSGLTMLANVLYIPVAAWWPREKLPTSWADENVPYLWFLWKDFNNDMQVLERWIEKL